MTARLFVGNLSSETTSQHLQDLFSQAGSVESCRVITDRETGASRGFAFVEMGSVDEARTAMNNFNGFEHAGKALKVNEAKQKA